MALVAAYRFDEEGDVTREGSVGTEPSLTVIAGVTDDAPGLLGNALVPSGGPIQIGRNSADLGTLASLRDFSISIWVRFAGATAGQPRVEANDGDSASFQISFGIPDGGGISAVDLSTLQGSTSLFGPQLDIGQWYHFVFTHDNTTGENKLYVDGVDLVTDFSATLLFTNDWTTMALTIWPVGQFDMLVVYDEVIDGATVAQLYNGGAGFDPTDEGGGDSSNQNLLTMGCG
jgi:hypothetical protein